MDADLKKGDKIKARQYLDYDVKTGKHGTALEEWPPYKVLSPKFFE